MPSLCSVVCQHAYRSAHFQAASVFFFRRPFGPSLLDNRPRLQLPDLQPHLFEITVDKGRVSPFTNRRAPDSRQLRCHWALSLTEQPTSDWPKLRVPMNLSESLAVSRVRVRHTPTHTRTYACTRTHTHKGREKRGTQGPKTVSGD